MIIIIISHGQLLYFCIKIHFIMQKYNTEEGHIFSKEDITSMIYWLLQQGWEKEDIIGFDDSEEWKKVAIIFFN